MAVRIRAFGSAHFLPKISPYFGLDGRKLPLRKEGQFVFICSLTATYQSLNGVRDKLEFK